MDMDMLTVLNFLWKYIHTFTCYYTFHTFCQLCICPLFVHAASSSDKLTLTEFQQNFVSGTAFQNSTFHRRRGQLELAKHQHEPWSQRLGHTTSKNQPANEWFHVFQYLWIEFLMTIEKIAHARKNKCRHRRFYRYEPSYWLALSSAQTKIS